MTLVLLSSSTACLMAQDYENERGVGCGTWLIEKSQGQAWPRLCDYKYELERDMIGPVDEVVMKSEE